MISLLFSFASIVHWFCKTVTHNSRSACHTKRSILSGRLCQTCLYCSRGYRKEYTTYCGSGVGEAQRFLSEATCRVRSTARRRPMHAPCHAAAPSPRSTFLSGSSTSPPTAAILKKKQAFNSQIQGFQPMNLKTFKSNLKLSTQNLGLSTRISKLCNQNLRLSTRTSKLFNQNLELSTQIPKIST